MYYALGQLQLKLKGNSGLPVGNGSQEKLFLWFCSRYRHLLQVSRQQSKGYRDSQAKVNRRVVYYGLFYGGSKTPFSGLVQCGSQGRTHIEASRGPHKAL
jgi:hypothetical protein